MSCADLGLFGAVCVAIVSLMLFVEHRLAVAQREHDAEAKAFSESQRTRDAIDTEIRARIEAETSKPFEEPSREAFQEMTRRTRNPRKPS